MSGSSSRPDNRDNKGQREPRRVRFKALIRNCYPGSHHQPPILGRFAKGMVAQLSDSNLYLEWICRMIVGVDLAGLKPQIRAPEIEMV